MVEAVKELIEAIVRDVAELPDYTSPDDWPEAMLVTAEELTCILADRLEALADGGGSGLLAAHKGISDGKALVIRQLEERLAAMAGALKPFAETAKRFLDSDPDDTVRRLSLRYANNAGHFRAAARAVQGEGEKG